LCTHRIIGERETKGKGDRRRKRDIWKDEGEEVGAGRGPSHLSFCILRRSDIILLTVIVVGKKISKRLTFVLNLMENNRYVFCFLSVFIVVNNEKTDKNRKRQKKSDRYIFFNKICVV
jgi:hypothetical protein